MLTLPAADRDRAHRDLMVAAVGSGDLHPDMAGETVAERDRERQLLDGELASARFARPEPGAPDVRSHLAGLLEGHSEQLSGLLVEEEKRASLVDQECGRRQ